MKPSYYQQPRASDLFDVLAYDPESALFIMEDRSLALAFYVFHLQGAISRWPTDSMYF